MKAPIKGRERGCREETLLCCKESKAQQATEDVYTGAKMLVRDHVSNHVSTCQARAGAVTVPPSYTTIRPEWTQNRQKLT